MALKSKSGTEVQTKGDKSAAKRIISERERFNQSIADRDFAAIESVLCEDCTLVPGEDAVLMSGRDQQLSAWQSIISQAPDAIYVRTPWRVDVSEDGGLAAEAGRWNGGWSSKGLKVSYQGRYFAKWRLEDDNWKIASEIFVTLKRSGATFG